MLIERDGLCAGDIERASIDSRADFSTGIFLKGYFVFRARSGDRVDRDVTYETETLMHAITKY